MQQPPSAPPQWSADGLWWWDGSQWRPRSEMMAPPRPAFVMPPPIRIEPTPGLRIFLLVVLGVAGLITGLFVVFGLLGVAEGANTSGDIVFFAVVIFLFAICAGSFVGVLIRTSWSRVASLVAGIALSLTCVGSLLGIPILVAAWRAPDLTKRPA